MTTTIDHARAAELERKYDTELNFRDLESPIRQIASVILVALSVYQYYTAGFGLPPEHWHNAIYIASVLGDTKGADPERLTAAKQQLRPEGERAVRRVLVIERLADTQNLRASEAELDERIEQLAARSGASTAEVYARLQKAGRLEVMEREITEEKVFAFLKAQSEIQEE